jgi:hypothetical protein
MEAFNKDHEKMAFERDEEEEEVVGLVAVERGGESNAAAPCCLRHNSNNNNNMILWSLVSIAALLSAFHHHHRHQKNALHVELSESSSPTNMRPKTTTTTIDQLRFDIATVSIEMMQKDTIQEARKSQLVDIGPFADLVELALDTFGVRKVYTELFETQQFAETVTAAARAKGGGWSEEFSVQMFKKPGTQPGFHYTGIPNDRKFLRYQGSCTGCLWWLRHWLGAVTADKLLRDGSLRLDEGDAPSEKENRLYDAASFMEELHVIQRSEHPDLVSFHAMHGFVWHYVTLTRPDLDAYPLDIAQDFCGEYLYRDAPVPELGDDIGQDCRHAFGHAVYFVLAVRETVGSSFSVRDQFRPADGFVLSEESMCEGYRICKGAPSKTMRAQCTGGMRHSYHLLSDNDTSAEVKRALDEQETRCEENSHVGDGAP